MKSFSVLLDTIEKVKQFVTRISLYEGDFDFVSGRYTIDAKSIMGIFSLDLTKPLQLNVHNEAIYDKVAEDFKEFIV